jgi:hypothetical protein
MQPISHVAQPWLAKAGKLLTAHMCLQNCSTVAMNSETINNITNDENPMGCDLVLNSHTYGQSAMHSACPHGPPAGHEWWCALETLEFTLCYD